ncbi:MAG: SRPBCC family protein [Bacteroidota bacterium]
MSIHRFTCNQFLPISVEEAWDFFSSPENLQLITPPRMNFKITSENLEKKTYAGQIISYRVSPLPVYRTTWVTEITHVQMPDFFVDEQRKGPYCMWHHQHHFKKADGGVNMTDIVHYEIPLGPIGDLMNSIMVRNEIHKIFEYRKKKLEELFSRK